MCSRVLNLRIRSFPSSSVQQLMALTIRRRTVSDLTIHPASEAHIKPKQMCPRERQEMIKNRAVKLMLILIGVIFVPGLLAFIWGGAVKHDDVFGWSFLLMLSSSPVSMFAGLIYMAIKS